MWDNFWNLNICTLLILQDTLKNDRESALRLLNTNRGQLSSLQGVWAGDRTAEPACGDADLSGEIKLGPDTKKEQTRLLGL